VYPFGILRSVYPYAEDPREAEVGYTAAESTRWFEFGALANSPDPRESGLLEYRNLIGSRWELLNGTR
jgi:hypothetical protein